MEIEEIHRVAEGVKKLRGIDRHHAALIAASAELKRREWLPIESAPRDNPRCLVFTPGPNHVMRERLVPEGLIRTVKEATHWMPLPQPPEVG